MIRAASALVLGLSLLGLMSTWVAATHRGRVGYAGLKGAPDGTEGVLSLFEVSRLWPPDRYEVRRGALSFVVHGDPRALSVGEEWTIGGVFQQGELIESWRAAAPGRRGKKLLGLLGLSVSGIIGLASLQITSDGLRIRG